MRFELLADNPGAIGTVARWYFDEWGSETPGATFEQVVADVSRYISRLGPPLIVVAKEGDILVAAAELKFREMSIYPQFEHWLGGVYVSKAYRGRGIGTAIATEVLRRARDAGVTSLYLQTVDLSGGIYRSIGFTPVEQVDYKGRRVLVMVAAEPASE